MTATATRYGAVGGIVFLVNGLVTGRVKHDRQFGWEEKKSWARGKLRSKKAHATKIPGERVVFMKKTKKDQKREAPRKTAAFALSGRTL